MPSAVALDRSDLLSVLALRTRAIRVWLAGIGLVAFGTACSGADRAAAIRTPAVARRRRNCRCYPFPQSSFRRSPFRSCTRRRWTAPVASPAKRQVVRPAVRRAATPPTRKYARTRRVQVPVVKNSYSVAPPKSSAASPSSKRTDPFAGVAVTEDMTGGVPATATDPARDRRCRCTIESTVGVVPPDTVDASAEDGGDPEEQETTRPTAVVPAPDSRTSDTATHTEGFRRLARTTPPSPPVAQSSTPTTSSSEDTTATTSRPAAGATSDATATTPTAEHRRSHVHACRARRSVAAEAAVTASTTAAPESSPQAAPQPALSSAPTTVWQVQGGRASASPHDGKAWNHKLRFADDTARAGRVLLRRPGRGQPRRFYHDRGGDGSRRRRRDRHRDVRPRPASCVVRRRSRQRHARGSRGRRDVDGVGCRQRNRRR